jgi:hypothetical protein
MQLDKSAAHSRTLVSKVLTAAVENLLRPHSPASLLQEALNLALTLSMWVGSNAHQLILVQLHASHVVSISTCPSFSSLSPHDCAHLPHTVMYMALLMVLALSLIQPLMHTPMHLITVGRVWWAAATNITGRSERKRNVKVTFQIGAEVGTLIGATGTGGQRARWTVVVHIFWNALQ